MPLTDSNGTKIYWEEDGAGDPLLMIMGLGYTHEMWYRSRPVLSKHLRMILFDNRGVGKSGQPEGPYTIGQMADDAAAVLDAAGVEKAHVMGMSMGGMIAQEFALRYPARVRKLVLGCTACGGPHAVRAEQGAVDMLTARARMTKEEAAEAAVPFIYDPATPRERIDEDLAVRNPLFPSVEAYSAQLAGIFKWQSYDRLGEIAAPALVIHGEHDRLIPPGNARVIAERIPGSKLVILPDASHIFVTDQPELAHRALLDFLL